MGFARAENFVLLIECMHADRIEIKTNVEKVSFVINVLLSFPLLVCSFLYDLI